jgi:6-phosphofructokinase 2
MPRIITLTMNPAVDVSVSADRVEPIRKIRCRMGRRDAGGGGLNVGRVAHRLGADVTAVYPTGGIVGHLLKTLVDEEGLESVTIPVLGQTREDFNVMDESAREQYRFVMPGPHLRGAEWMQCLKVLAELSVEPDYVCASGSLPPGAPVDFYARVAEIVASWGVRFALDSSGAALKSATDQPIQLLKPNLGELRELTQSPLDSREAMIVACRNLVRQGRVELVALTLGADGALLVSRDRVLRADALPIQPQSTVGAGDSFLGAMVWALASDKSLEEAFRYGVAGGSAALLAHGTELCRAADTRRLLHQVSIEDITESVVA